MAHFMLIAECCENSRYQFGHSDRAPTVRQGIAGKRQTSQRAGDLRVDLSRLGARHPTNGQISLPTASVHEQYDGSALARASLWEKTFASLFASSAKALPLR